ncbi:MAG: hypothetical protein KF724_11310 [Phycisphaeraceae bacterium]|nr:hypothetical protein [Phycisphaeraceae bacterium]
MMLASLLAPALLALACLSAEIRRRAMGLLWLAPLPAIAAALWSDGADHFIGEGRLQVMLTMGGPRRLLLGAIALLWALAGGFAWASMGRDPHRGRFAVAWLLSLTGCLGVFVAGDLISFYLLFSLSSLAAYVLVIHDHTPAARRAANAYLALTIFGEAFLLLAFIMLASNASDGSILIREVVQALPESPNRSAVLVLLMLGFGIKAGLVPLHGWLPLAHPAAPTPASAVLSGAIIKTGIIGFLLLLPLDHALPSWGMALLVIGFITAIAGVVIGVTQSSPKTILAYSSVSQMGVTAALIGAGAMAGASAVSEAAAFYAMHHVLTKGALFLAVGLIASVALHQRWWIIAPCLILSLSFAGMPFTGGFLAKEATKPWFTGNLVALLATVSSVGSAFLMLHFMHHLVRVPARSTPPMRLGGMTTPWALAAIAAVALPWMLMHSVLRSEPGALITPATLWSASWPVMIGGAVAFAWTRLAPFAPAIPGGDVIVFGEAAAVRLVRAAPQVERLEGALGRWAVGGTFFLLITVLLAAALRGAAP